MKALTNKMVAKMSALSLEGFLREYFLPGFPVIVSDGMAHWPARTKWKSMDYLQKVAGDRTIPVEVIYLSVHLFIINTLDSLGFGEYVS